MVNDSFKALSHPIRRGIVERLAAGPATVGDATDGFGVSKPAITKHLKVLEEAGLISRRIEGTKRPCRLAPEGIDTIDKWLSQLRKALSASYERLDAVLAAMDEPAKKRHTKRKDRR